MHFRYKSFLFFLISQLFLPLASFALSDLDSLQKAFQEATADTSRVKILNNIAWEYMFNRPELALENAQRALDLAMESAYDDGLGQAANAIAVHYAVKSDYPRAISYFNMAKDVYERVGNSKGLSGALNNLGNVYRLQGNYTKALAVYFKVFQLLRTQKKGSAAEAAAVNNIGLVYELQGDIDQALHYYHQSLALEKRENRKKGIAISYHNIGQLLFEQKNMLDSALYYFYESIKIKEEINNVAGIATSYNSIGEVLNKRNDHEKALEYHLKALSIQELQGLQANISISHRFIAETYLSKKAPKKSLPSALKSYELATEIGAIDHLSKSGLTLAAVYEALGEYQKANGLLHECMALNDSLVNDEKLKEIGRLESVYDLEKMEAENELLRKEQKLKEVESGQKNIFMIFGSLFLLVTLFFSLHFFRKNRKIQKANFLLIEQKQQITEQAQDLQQLNKEIRKQTQELVRAHALIKERNLAIADSMESARYIQQAVFPSIKRVKDIIPESFVYFKPKEVISGDFYWIAEKNTKEHDGWVLAAVDCIGHGIPGAFMSMVADALLNHIVHDMGITQPDQILQQMQQRILSSNHQHGAEMVQGVDIAICRYDRAQKVLSFAGARNGMLFFHDKQLLHWKGNRFSIGESHAANTPFSLFELQIEQPVMVYLFSDGYLDQFGGKEGKKFMLKRFKNKLQAIHSQPMHQQKELLEQEMDSWITSEEGTKQAQVDDMLVIGFKIG